MATIFTKIINGEIPCYKVAESEDFFAFLDIRPQSIGHTLVVPKKEVDYFFDLEDDLYTALMLFVKKIAQSIDEVIPCERVGVVVFGLEVPHAHVHLIPITQPSDMNLSGSTPIELSPEEFAATADKIAKAFLATGK